MKNLRTYKENGYNYIVVLNGHSEYYNYEVFANRSTAERYNENEVNGYGDVLTFRQATKEYPETFKF